MKIRVRFIVVDTPPGLPVSRDGSTEMEVADGGTVDAVLASFPLPPDAAYLTLVNEESVPVADRPARTLFEGDLLTIFSPLKGG